MSLWTFWSLWQVYVKIGDLMVEYRSLWSESKRTPEISSLLLLNKFTSKAVFKFNLIRQVWNAFDLSADWGAVLFGMNNYMSCWSVSFNWQVNFKCIITFITRETFSFNHSTINTESKKEGKQIWSNSFDPQLDSAWKTKLPYPTKLWRLDLFEGQNFRFRKWLSLCAVRTNNQIGEIFLSIKIEIEHH